MVAGKWSDIVDPSRRLMDGRGGFVETRPSNDWHENKERRLLERERERESIACRA